MVFQGERGADSDRTSSPIRTPQGCLPTPASGMGFKDVPPPTHNPLPPMAELKVLMPVGLGYDWRRQEGVAARLWILKHKQAQAKGAKTL